MTNFDHNRFRPDLKPEKKPKEPKSKTKPLSLIEKLDHVFSIYTRKSVAYDSGFCYCYTCDSLIHWKDLENGHYCNRTHMGTRWSEINNHPQCKTCNREKKGNIKVYRERLIKQYGIKEVEALEYQSKKISKFSKEELKEGIEYYTQQNKKFEYIK